MDLSAEDLVARVLRPDPSRRAEADDAVAGITDPTEAWEVLATRGLLPMDWVHDARRSFGVLCTSCSGTGDRYGGWWRDGGGYTGRPRPFEAWTKGGERPCRDCVRGLRLTPAPPTVRAAVALASDAAGVATAEALAREVVAWLAGIFPRTRYPRAIVWRVDDDSPEIPMLVRGIEARPGTAVLRRLGAPQVAPQDELWRAVSSARGVRNPRGDTVAEAFATDAAEHAALAARDQPGARACDALLSLWETGYGLDAVTAEAIVLLAPEARAAR